MPTGTITALKAQINDSQRVNVFIDGAFAIGVSLKTLADEGLYVGKTLDAPAWERLDATEQASKALQSAVRLIEARPRSVAEVRQRLQQKGFVPAAIDFALERLTELGMLDDAAFSRLWVENRRTFRPRGTMALRAELRQKGVSSATIAAILAEADDGADAERDRAFHLARNALHRYADAPDRATFTRRLGGFLQRRGFTLDVIRPLINQFWAELQQPSSDDAASGE
jgi:regulatory protein